jgi:hypothetical protein
MERVLVDAEGEVTDEENGSWLVGLVAVTLSTLLGVWWWARSGVVDLDCTSIDLLAVECDGLGSGLEVGKLDVTKTTRTVGFTVDHDTCLDDLTALGELGSEPVVVDVPRELTDKDVGGGLLLALGGGNGLGLLGGLLGLILGLALAW